MTLLENYEQANPYSGMELSALEYEIQELDLERQDHEHRGDFEHADQASEHRVLAVEALLRMSGVRW